jgi:hypothetical protein
LFRPLQTSGVAAPYEGKADLPNLKKWRRSRPKSIEGVGEKDADA